MKPLPAALILLTGALLVPAAVVAAAGIPPVNTVQAGAWSDPATWDGGVPPSSVGAAVNHDVVLTAVGQIVGQLQIGALASATLTLAAGDLTVNGFVNVGQHEEGHLDLAGTALVCQSLSLGGFAGGLGTATLSGGSVLGGWLRIGSTGPGSLLVDGAGSSMVFTGGVPESRVDGEGTIVIRPTANGSAGLTTIVVDDLVMTAGSTIELDITHYTPELGDSWDVLSATGSVGGEIDFLEAPEGYALGADDSTPGVVRVTVTAVPFASWVDLGGALAGSNGTPSLVGEGPLTGGALTTLELAGALPLADAYLVLGVTELGAPFKGGTMVPSTDVLLGPIPIDASGAIQILFTWPTGVPAGVSLYWQYWIQDPGGPVGFAASNGVESITP